MLFPFTFSVDKDVIKVYHHKNVKFFCQNLVDVALENSRCVGQFKKRHLILEMIIAALKSRLSFIAFFDPYLMVGVGEIELSKTLSLT